MMLSIIALVIIGFFIYLRVYTNSVKQHGTSVKGTILSCNNNETRNPKDNTLLLQYQELQISFLFKGEEIIKTIRNDSLSFSVGNTIDCIYVQHKKKDFLVLAPDMELNNSGSHFILLAFGIVLLLLSFIIKLVDLDFITNEQLLNAFIPFICVVFILAGITLLINYYKHSHIGNCEKLSGTIKDIYKKHSSSGNNFLYYPIFSYWYQGEMYTHQSSVGNSTHNYNIGDKVTLVRNLSTGKIAEKYESLQKLFIGVLFFIIGIVILILFSTNII